MTDSTRAAFEADYVLRIGEAPQCVIGYRLLRDREGRYRQGLVEAEWQGWQAAYQAARQSALEEAAKVCDERAIDHAGFTECEWEAQQCAEAIRQLAADKRPEGERDA